MVEPKRPPAGAAGLAPPPNRPPGGAATGVVVPAADPPKEKGDLAGVAGKQRERGQRVIISRVDQNELTHKLRELHRKSSLELRPVSSLKGWQLSSEAERLMSVMG